MNGCAVVLREITEIYTQSIKPYGLSPLKKYCSDTKIKNFNAVGEHLPAVERPNLGQRLSLDGRHTKG